MKTQNGFTLLENEAEVKSWLAKQNVTRTITRLQVHHMDLPNYSTWTNTDKKVFSEPHFGRTESLDAYGKKTWNYSDGHGKYIAQHFNVFPDGKITTGRNLNSTPIGIKGWNTNAICIEIYGDFDKGVDVMNSAQKEAVIYLYGLLCKRFNISVDTSHIRPHCWFTASGTYLGGYYPSQSAKSCPGTNFMGYGCSRDGFAKFIKLVKDYVDGKSSTTNTTTTTYKTGIYRVTCDTLNIRSGAGTSYDKVGEVKKGESYTIDKVSGSWGHLKSDAGWICISASYCEYVGTSTTTSTFKNYIVRVTVDVLNGRKGYGTSYGVETTLKKGDAVTIVEEKTVDGEKWGKTLSGYCICLKYTEFVRYA